MVNLLIYFSCTHNIKLFPGSVLSVIAVIKVTSGELFVEGGGLPGRFRTAQFHFHWGRSNSGGSEHTLNGHRYPLEAITLSSNTFFESLHAFGFIYEIQYRIGYFYVFSIIMVDYHYNLRNLCLKRYLP